jgi:hypothetical protein
MENPLAHKIVRNEEKALLLMVNLLNNLEEFKEMSDNLQTLIEANEMQDTHLLSMFKVLINGIKLEYKQLDF